MAPAHDLRFALRTFRRSPAFTTVIVLILAIGIGANTAMFTLVSDILLKPLPSPDGHRIMHVGTSNVSKEAAIAGVSYPEFLDWRAQSRSFFDLALVQYASFNVSDGVTAAEPLDAARVTANSFRTLRVGPVLGRDFRTGEDRPGAPPVVILGYGVWMRRYGGDPGVIGKAIRVDEAPATVIGVMPEGMKFPMAAEIWMPLIQTAEFRSRELRRFEAFGRLRDGVSIDEARAEFDILGRRLETEYPDTNRGVRPVITPYTQRAVQGQMRLILALLQGMVAFLLLIVCANAANLLLSRSLSRAQEISIRRALGASRATLVRQLLVESIAYAALGGTLGLLLAYWGVRAFDVAVAGTGRPYWLTFGMDYRVFGFFAAVVALTGVAFGLAPALHSLRADVNAHLKSGGRANSGARSVHRLASTFVVAQLALTLILLVGFGLVGRSIVNIYRRATGFDTESVLTMRIHVPAGRYQRAEGVRRLQERLLSDLRRLPKVTGAAIASHLPLGGSREGPVEPEGYSLPDGKPIQAASLTVSADYFRTFGIRIVAGREFLESDGAPGQENVIVNQRFAAQYWRGQQALGKRLRITSGEKAGWFTVAGISADVRQNNGSGRETSPVVYVPSRSAPDRAFLIALRTAVAPGTLSDTVRKEIRAIDPDLPVTSVMSMAEIVRLAHWPHRVFGTMFAIFGLVAAALAGLGMYSVMAYSVGMRKQEIGLRIAVGATGSNIRRMVIARGLRQVALGLVIGCLGAVVITRALGAILAGVSSVDPVTFGGAAALQTAIALLACWLPARRASRIEAIQALRHD